ncbi:hypothetical protein B5X24_HaOG210962 [Helicoverpa armigera]|nr:hypothetical protein B5X24_HaOG210962 [Helicoverpa armigera]
MLASEIVMVQPSNFSDSNVFSFSAVLTAGPGSSKRTVLVNLIMCRFIPISSHISSISRRDSLLSLTHRIPLTTRRRLGSGGCALYRTASAFNSLKETSIGIFVGVLIVQVSPFAGM